MITTQGFNALLKIVEEPPEHLVFVFATTEPEKVLPTIRSRTHHYPFRLIPPGTLAQAVGAHLRRGGGHGRARRLPAGDPGGRRLGARFAVGARSAGRGGGAGGGHVRAGGRAAGRHRRLADRRRGGCAGRGRSGGGVRSGRPARRGRARSAPVRQRSVATAARSHAAAGRAGGRRARAGGGGRRRDRPHGRAVGQVRRGHPHPLRRDPARRPHRDARRHRPPAAAGAALRPHAAARRDDRGARPAGAPGAPGAPFGHRRRPARAGGVGCRWGLERLRAAGWRVSARRWRQVGGCGWWGDLQQAVRCFAARCSVVRRSVAHGGRWPAARVRCRARRRRRIRRACHPGCVHRPARRVCSGRDRRSACRVCSGAPPLAGLLGRIRRPARRLPRAHPPVPRRRLACRPQAPLPPLQAGASHPSSAAAGGLPTADAAASAPADGQPPAPAASAASSAAGSPPPTAGARSAGGRPAARIRRSWPKPVSDSGAAPTASPAGARSAAAVAGSPVPASDPRRHRLPRPSAASPAGERSPAPAAGGTPHPSAAAPANGRSPASASGGQPPAAATPPTAGGPPPAGAAPGAQAEENARPATSAVGAADVRRVWQEIQEAVKQRKKRTAALLVSATVRAVENDTLVLSIGTAPLARLLSEQSNTDVIAESLHAVLGVRWRVRCEHGDGSAPRAQEARQAPRATASPPSTRTPQPPGQAPDGSPPAGGPAGMPPVGGQASGKAWSRTSGGGAPSADAAGGRPPADRPQAAGGRWQSGAAQASGGRPAGRPAGREDGVPLPPEPPEEDTPPDDEEAMLAELEAGPSEQQHAPARSDPEEAAIALLTSQLGARAIDRR